MILRGSGRDLDFDLTLGTTWAIQMDEEVKGFEVFTRSAQLKVQTPQNL